MTDLIRPVPGPITQTFEGAFTAEQPGYLRADVIPHRGKRVPFPGGVFRKDLHLAIDYGCPTGTPVKAMGTGPIVRQGVDSTSGNAVYVQQRIWRGPNFDLYMLYYHLKSSSFKFALGKIAPQGAPIALSGNTGWSTAPHLHVEMIRLPRGANPNTWYSGLRLDPQAFINGAATLAAVD